MCSVYQEAGGRNAIYIVYAENFLSIYNRKKNFSRKAVDDGLSEIQKLNLVEPIMTGQWRCLW